MSIAPGWYKDPAEPTTQRYWDGEGWVGAPLPADAQPPDGPPPQEPSHPPEPRLVPTPTTVAAAGRARHGSPVPPPRGTAAGPPVAGTQPTPPGTQPTPPGTQPIPEPHPGVPPGPLPPSGQLPPDSQVPPGWVYPYRRALPTPMPHGLPLAMPGARLVARLIDIAIVGGLALIANAWFLFELGRTVAALYSTYPAVTPLGEEDANRISTLMFVITLVTAAVWLAYEVPATANSGQTFGKRVLGIKIVRLEQEGRLGFGRALRRWWTLGLPTVLWTCCVGFVLQFVDCLFVAIDRPLHQALHDKSAHTVVVHIGRPTPNESGGKA